MKTRLRKYITRFILLVLSFQTLNMSVSGRAADENSSTPIDDSVNIADHAVEFIVENILGFTNAFPEFREIKNAHTFSYYQKMQTIPLFSFSNDNKTHDKSLLIAPNYALLQVNTWSEYIQKINTPPPEFI
jgi:hypothetical protein